MLRELLSHVTASPRPVVTDHCARARATRASCSDCIDACPSGAIHADTRGALEIDAECTNCEICVAACPREGLLDARGRQDDRIRCISRKLSGGASRVVFSCARSPLGGSEILPCLAAIAPAALFQFAERADVDLATPECAGCNRAVSMQRWVSEVLRVVDLQRATDSRRAIRLVAVSSCTGSPSASGVSRRDLARLLSRGGPATESPRASGARRLRGAGIVKVPRALGIGRVSVSMECVGCLVCEQVCPENAIKRVEARDSLSLMFDGARCTACGACEDSCVPRAIHLARELAPAAPPETLIELSLTLCDDCGAQFASKGASQCPDCRLDRPAQFR